jgi:hypothetical protein
LLEPTNNKLAGNEDISVAVGARAGEGIAAVGHVDRPR